MVLAIVVAVVVTLLVVGIARSLEDAALRTARTEWEHVEPFQVSHLMLICRIAI